MDDQLSETVKERCLSQFRIQQVKKQMSEKVDSLEMQLVRELEAKKQELASIQ